MKVKYKFFLNRILTYFSFLLIPVWIQETQTLNLFLQSIILLMYMMFMAGQWYLFGKEIDHRLKIYYKAKSSMERILYRITLGYFTMIILFNIISIFPSYMTNYFFWAFFGCLGIFYSWPTRGKIIEESMSDQFGEFKFLDGFERTVLFLSFITFLVSLPELPLFQNIDALKLYFDPKELVSPVLWNFLSVTYSPFSKYPKLFNLIWSLHFYFIGLGVFVFTFYCLVRHFFSRRLGVLGVFSILSTWSFSRILEANFFSSISTTFSLVWLWALLWSTKSGTYRTGLYTGLVVASGVMINVLNIFFLPVTLILGYLFMSNQTKWYRVQWLKYNIFGSVVALVLFAAQAQSLSFEFLNIPYLYNLVVDLIYKKAFYSIAPIGFILALILSTSKGINFFKFINLDTNELKEFLFLGVVIVIFSLVLSPYFGDGFSYVWMLAFFSLFPLEWIFQTISRLRSKRNIIYVMYILVCLLDSHLEGRLRIVGKMFLDSDSFRYFIQL